MTVTAKVRTRPVTNSRTHRTQGKPRARERIAAERAARKRAEARRRLLLAFGSVTAVVAIVATLVTLKLTATPTHLTASESAAPAAVTRQVTTVPAGVLDQASPGQVATALRQVPAGGSALTIGGKPGSGVGSEESCLCRAAE